MRLKVINCLKKKNEEFYVDNININGTLKEFKEKLIKDLCIKGYSYSRIGLSYKVSEDSKERPLQMSESNQLLINYDNFSEKSVVLIKDIGLQVSYKLSFLIEYIGPLVIFPLLYFYFNSSKKTQTICLLMSTFHYSKRIVESLFVHIFSHDTMPLKSLLRNVIYYWFFYGFFCGYFLFRPQYYEPQSYNPLRFFFCAFFLSAEVKNLKCHMILRELKIKRQGSKGIPNGEGFELVTCANYFWEIMSWFCFSIVSFHWSFVLFMLAGFSIMKKWAEKKHNFLLKKFGDRYPKNRKIIIPYYY